MRLAFSKKVENKKLGAMARTCRQMALPDRTVYFVLFHYEVQSPERFRLIQKQLRVYCRPLEGSLTGSVIDALRTFRNLEELFFLQRARCHKIRPGNRMAVSIFFDG